MKNKEERIKINKVWICKKPKNKDMYKCDCIGSPNDMAGLQVCPVHPQIAGKEGMTRREAIEKMAKALCLSAVKSAELCKKNCDKPCIMWKSYEIYAEAVLNALLGDK